MAATTRRSQKRPTSRPPRPDTAREAGASDAEDVWLTVPEIMKELKIDRRTWQHWVTRKQTPKMHRLPSGRYRVHRDDYQEWLDGLQVDA
ncbi:helix-turn-helix transcriptional regulator [Nonomuraea sp. SYSU D8015]|uniref:helix-turn-helix transcriptional regulator n=1 Tax=Nonomuraea sp. SYSU D8015 TaxID=2593644 RepID=UPI001660CD4F|nr:helix-turn-helix domain-containing protein [Nonomuraea sp. SYSU D8015]